ncbi:MAG: ACP S-malonyltransferase, partial [Chlamydiae bacterium]|nr:ACP S-malonyltransferase [Chlamydiota bacterium]
MKNKKIAFVFPGQGAQYPGMGKEFAASFSIAKETFEEADEILRENLSRIVFEGPQEFLTKTLYSQLGIFVTSAAIFRVFQEQMPEMTPAISSGLSLGEYTALFASGRLSFQETLLLVKERARLMNEACEKTVGTMAAVLGFPSEEIEKAIQGISGVWVANYNCPGQVVISGTKIGVEKASLLLKEKGAKRVIPLEVHGAFHSPLMESAEKGLFAFVKIAPIQESKIQFVMNVTGDFVHSIEEIRKNLVS